MKLESVETFDVTLIKEAVFDLAFVSSGYESRCCDLGLELQKNGQLSGALVIGIAFQERQEIKQREMNDAILRGLCSRWVIVSEKDGDSVEKLVSNAVLEALGDKSRLRVFVDISSMSRPWYAGVVLALRAFGGTRPLEVTFGYTVGEFEEMPKGYPPSEIVAPVRGFCAAESPDRPTALVLSLGYDPGRGLGLREYLDPELTLVLCSSNDNFPEYKHAVEEANHDLFELVEESERFEYDITDPAATFHTLRSLTSGLARDWRVVLASVGPKLTGLIFFLLGVVDERLSVWRVSGGTKIEPRNVIGRGRILLKTTWV